MKRNFEHAYFTDADLKHWIDFRAGETKLGENVRCYSPGNEDWKECKYHILGIAESIGPQLNNGLTGAENGFSAFVSRFLNIQSNVFLIGDTVCLHGKISPSTEIDAFETSLIEELDAMVEHWTEMVVTAGGIPIVIGGGHNNALGLINGVAASFGKGIAVVNLDPHADVRATQTRHSGNAFSTAYEKGTLNRYHVLGLHQSYNNTFILSQLEKMNAHVRWFEDWIDDASAFKTDVDEVFSMLKVADFGLELDMDSIAYMPSSAFTPSGITVEQARYYIRKMARNPHVRYLHLPEAAPSNKKEDKEVGKTLAYLVSDFIKCNSNV